MLLPLRWFRVCLPALLRRRVVLHTLLLTLALSLLLLIFYGRLLHWLWPDTGIQQLLGRAEVALQQGRLSAADGSGARELYAAALALDADRGVARKGLARTGEAALAQAQQALTAGQLDRAQQALTLARELEMPQIEIARLEGRIRQHQAARAGLTDLLARAELARQQGRLDGTPDSALPLYQQVLELAPERVDALEGREDALAELLQRTVAMLSRGQLRDAAAMLQAVRQYDGGHIDLPAVQAEFNRVLESRRRQAQRQLRRGRIQAAEDIYAEIVAAQPEDAVARQGLQAVASAYAAQAVRQAEDFHFDDAEQLLNKARALAPELAAVQQAEPALARSRQLHAAQLPKLSAAAREQRLVRLLHDVARAEAAKEWVTPPGGSAYDKLRLAQAIAPRDRRVLRAVARIVPATRDCFDDELSNNRVRAAGACLDAWQALAPADAQLLAARRRLAQRWIAIGSERLGAGDSAFAQQALQQVRRLDAATPGLKEFARRVHDAQAAGP